MKILVAGFQHETNTFAPSKAGYDNFVRGEGFPAMARGDELYALEDVNLALGGFIGQAKKNGHSLVPVIWAGASPCAHVLKDAYERIVGEIVDAACTREFDAIYLDLHGAMVAEHTDDGEGELLARLRSVIGDKVPLVASLDLHANVTKAMLNASDGLLAYRTYPHVDMAETGRAALSYLESLMSSSMPVHKAVRRLPFLIPLNAMCTLIEPACSAYATLASMAAPGLLSLSFAPGFPAADFDECGPVLWGYGHDREAVEEAVEQLYRQLTEDEEKWGVDLLDPSDAVAQAIRISSDGDTVVIADTQDNPGAGGDSNTTGLLRELIAQDAQDAALGLMYDPAAALAAHQAGVGARIRVALGGGAGVEGDEPLEGEFEVTHLSNGRCVFEGPMMTGMKADLGPVACLKTGGVSVVVSSVKVQMLDRNLYRVGGVVPERMRILVNKSSVHFRADFGAIAKSILVARSPGPVIADPADLPWKRLAPGLRTRPGGRPFSR